MRNCRIFLTLICILCLTGSAAGSEFMDQLKANYTLLDMDLLNNVGEVATVENFVYEKDFATFTFTEGQIHLLRYVEGRPTTAIFNGKGHATMIPPSHLERMSLLSVTKDSVVEEDFDVCLIRFADDLDLKLKEKFSFEQKELKWKEFTQMKQAQNEVYFKPIVYHRYDNFFQLLRSIYERNSDGYFWIDFNRYNFCYDPNQPEPVSIDYEFEPADVIATQAVNLQRGMTETVHDLDLSSTVRYATTSINKTATLTMGGIDGTKLDAAESEMKLVVNADSLKFVSTFLHFNLKEDSIYCNGKPVDYHRRKDFNFIGIILPEYAYKGDTLTLTYWYHGKDYAYTLPYVEDPTPTPHTMTFITPKGFNYLMPGMGEVTELNGKQKFQVVPEQPYDKFYFQAYASNHDTVTAVSDMGITVNFLKSKSITKQLNCYVPDDLYETSVMDAFNYMTARVGNPAGTFEIFVYPENYYTMPGLVEIPQVLCYTEGALPAFGGMHLFAGYSVAKQWFGNLLKPATEREFWLRDAASEFLNLLQIQHNEGDRAYYSNLLNRRDTLYTLYETGRDRTLGAGMRTPAIVRCNKGVWLFHMLRYLMFDLERRSEDRFNRFFYELCMTANNTRFTTRDVVNLAEKHYGEPLDWFFDQWLSCAGYPELDVEYSIAQKEGGWFIDAIVNTKNVPADFRMPIMLRVTNKGGSPQFVRETVTGAMTTLEVGPFDFQPDELVFNELYSILSKDKVKKK